MKTITSLAILLFAAHLCFAQGTRLFGTTAAGGADSSGTIFIMGLDGADYLPIHVFDSLNGYACHSSLTQGPDGELYGVTLYGGASDAGTLFTIHPDNGAFTKLLDFDYFNTGGYPEGDLLLANDGKLYGLASGGGTNSAGTLFSYDPAAGMFEVLYNFDYTLGRYPYGSPVQALDGKLYGMTYDGGNVGGGGALFSYDIAADTVVFPYTFTLSTGAYPYGSLLALNDGKLYGTTSDGGIYNYGVIFSFNPADSTYTVLHNFNDTTGAIPYGSLVLHNDGLLYGTASAGGSGGIYGTIFNIDVVSGAYGDVFDFNGANGASPSADLLVGSDGRLYGTTAFGGADDGGVVFAFDPSNSNFTVLKDLDASGGKYSYSNLIELPLVGLDEKTNDVAVLLYPNPARGAATLAVRSNSTELYTLMLMDMTGRKLRTERLSIQNGVNTIPQDISALAGGVYMVNLISESGRQATCRLVVE